MEVNTTLVQSMLISEPHQCYLHCSYIYNTMGNLIIPRYDIFFCHMLYVLIYIKYAIYDDIES